MVPHIITELTDKWHSDGNFQDFVSDWNVLDDCPLGNWCVSQGDILFSEGRRRFRLLMSQSPNCAFLCHYNIGFLVSYDIRIEWTLGICKNPAIAANLWIEDETLTDEQDEILFNCISDPVYGLPNYINEINAGRLTRKKTSQKLYNENSEIVGGIIARANNS